MNAGHDHRADSCSMVLVIDGGGGAAGEKDRLGIRLRSADYTASHSIFYIPETWGNPTFSAGTLFSRNKHLITTRSIQTRKILPEKMDVI